LAATLLLLLSLYMTDKTVDIHLYDTMIVMPMTFFLWIGTLCLIIIVLLYGLLHEYPSKKLFIGIHIVLTTSLLIAVILLISPPSIFFPPIDSREAGMTFNKMLSHYREEIFTYTAVTSLLAATQIVFVFYLFWPVRKKPAKLS
jgi:hypothetical protein